ncbi:MULTISPECIES: phage protein Gp27 family protein [unclassified Saccharibacter]|nr:MULTISPECIES: phage protein Gp27 family protein [unclassified Saccharibacter]MXV35826.1 DUF3486 family protein [Saccharibacter sp. EH611]MXV57947.1 DUF3486 family protein [Saccharibacter sp. EH70]MXV66342.1 DUF3486 family protein [Saccharibacter sp. EH60]
MARRSKISRLPPELKRRIGELWDAGATLDQVMEALRGVDVSRSSLGRHIQQRDKMVERLRRSRAVADSVVQNLGDKSPGETQAVVIESLFSIIFDMFGGDNAEDAATSLQNNPKSMSMLAGAIRSLAQARQLDVTVRTELEDKARQKAERDAKNALTKAAKQQGLSKETVNAIMGGAFGVRS